VTCPTATSCFAAGSYSDGTHEFFQPMVGRWNGSAWRLTPAPAPTAPVTKSRGVLSGVACATATRCFAVGNYDVGNGSGKRNLVEQWTGKAWSIASRLRPAGSQSSVLGDVECFSAQRCFAVGSWNFESVSHAFIAQWSANAWSIVTVPHIHGDGEIKQSRLLHISCVRATSCFAVGSYVDTRDTKALTMRFDGTRWSWVQTPPLPKQITYTSLSTVSCATGTSCHGVGRYGDAAAYGGECCVNAPRAMRWNGLRWLVVDTPSRQGRRALDLYGISCPAVAACVVVGTSTDAAVVNSARALVERWDGTHWTVASGPTGPTTLNAITCGSPTACMAVGAAGRQPAVARLSGGHWTATTVPVSITS
jgi:hypothetical protein